MKIISFLFFMNKYLYYQRFSQYFWNGNVRKVENAYFIARFHTFHLYISLYKKCRKTIPCGTVVILVFRSEINMNSTECLGVVFSAERREVLAKKEEEGTIAKNGRCGKKYLDSRSQLSPLLRIRDHSHTYIYIYIYTHTRTYIYSTRHRYSAETARVGVTSGAWRGNYACGTATAGSGHTMTTKGCYCCC